MSGEWKPGDVALIEAGCWANRVRAIRSGVPSNMGWAYCGTHDGKSTQNWVADSSGIANPLRRLVVIDPEDRAEVERLRDLWDDAFAEQEGIRPNPRKRGVRGNALQAALREFADPKPPKPEEPIGRWAVVEDANGVQWCRIFDDLEPWLSEKHGSPARRLRCSYDEIDVARVRLVGIEVPS